MGGSLYNGLYREAVPERGTFFKLQVYERVGISLVEVYERVGKSVTLDSEKAQKGQQIHFKAVKKLRKQTFCFCDLFIFERQCIYSSRKGWVPFLSKMVYKRVGIPPWDRASLYKYVVITPPPPPRGAMIRTHSLCIIIFNPNLLTKQKQ